MDNSWSIFTEDLDEEFIKPQNGPSSLEKKMEDMNLFEISKNTPINSKKPINENKTEIEPPKKVEKSFIDPQSAPITMKFEPFSETTAASYQYATIYFRINRSEILKYSTNLNLKEGDFVITEADRGVDIGKIISLQTIITQRDSKNAREILRKATTQEIDLIPQQKEKEKKASEICQAKAAELGLQMKITGTEFQFDGKKLTIYFSAPGYIDFRELVRSLFKIFETRIWMVWYDGTGPVKDVLDQKKNQQFYN